MSSCFFYGMNVSDWNHSTFRESLLWLDAQIEKRENENDLLLYNRRLDRLNTFYIINSFGASVKKPENLYKLGDEMEEVEIVNDIPDEVWDKFN